MRSREPPDADALFAASSAEAPACRVASLLTQSLRSLEPRGADRKRARCDRDVANAIRELRAVEPSKAIVSGGADGRLLMGGSTRRPVPASS
jgi:hypothetical protein